MPHRPLPAALVWTALCSGVPGPAHAQLGPEALIGTWTTPLAEQSAGGMSAYVRERLVFEPGRNTIRIEAFADARGEIPLFVYASHGPYEVAGESDAVPGAYLLDARNEASTVTILTDAPDLWPVLNLGGCDLRVGVPIDIAGCVSGPPFNAADCTERDLVRIDGDTLRLGARATDRCSVRPATLGETRYQRE